EDELPFAHADLVAGRQAGGGGEATPVEISAVLRGGVVDLAALGGVDEDGTMPAADVGGLEHDVVVGRAADGGDTNLGGVDGTLMDEPEPVAVGGAGLAEVFLTFILDEGGAFGLGRVGRVGVFGRHRLPAAGPQQVLAGAAVVLSPRSFQVHAVQPGIG